MPVLIKTPACPLAVHPAARDAAGSWSGERVGNGLRLCFSDGTGRLAAFALVGAEAVAQRTRLAGQVAMPAGGW